MKLLYNGLSTGYIDHPFTGNYWASEGEGAYTYTVDSGALPDGLSLNEATGEISGTPTALGDFTFTIKATDEAYHYASVYASIQIVSWPYVLYVGTPPTGHVGLSYSHFLYVTDGRAAIFSITSGDLPPGISFSQTGIFSGVPTLAGTYPLSVRAVDYFGRYYSADMSITVDDTPPAPGALSIAISPTTLPEGRQGSQYSAQAYGLGGTPPYSYSATGLPDGIDIDPATGILSGVPTLFGVSVATLTVTDAVAATDSLTSAITIRMPNEDPGAGGDTGGSGTGGTGGGSGTGADNGSETGSAVTTVAVKPPITTPMFQEDLEEDGGIKHLTFPWIKFFEEAGRLAQADDYEQAIWELNPGGGAGGSGDVVGPAGATDGNLAVFDGATGKLLKDGGPVPTGAGVPGDTVADLDGTGAAGVSTDYSRKDHKHADSARHTHANKTTLDAIEEAYTTAEQTKLGALPDAATLAAALGAKADTASLATVATTGSYDDLSGKPTIPGLVIGYGVPDGSPGTNLADMLAAPRAGSLSKCKVITKASDPAVDLTFDVLQNGVSVFGVAPTVAHGTATGTVSTFTGLTSVPLAVAADDVFTLDISSGSSSWKFTVQLES